MSSNEKTDHCDVPDAGSITTLPVPELSQGEIPQPAGPASVGGARLVVIMLFVVFVCSCALD